MLGWSINLFRVFGIQLAVHATFLLLLVYWGYTGWMEGGAAGMAWSIGLITLFFVCVTLHELGHSLTARRYGVQTPRILLLPIGGMAEMDHIPRKPSAEFFITIMGPAVNFVIAALLLPFTWREVLGMSGVEPHSLSELLAQLFLANFVMGIFNFLPIYPMDGGRILRSILAIWLPYLRATWWALMTARVLAPILAFVAFYFFGRPMLGVLFIFILLAGNTEYRLLLRREAESAHWAELAKQAAPVTPDEPPPLVTHGRN